MALNDPYATLAELKGYLQIPAAKVSLDAALTSALESASEEIERHCNRQFNKETVATARIYEPETLTTACVDDFHTTTDLVVEIDGSGDGTFETAITSYELTPLNGIVDGQPGWPFYKVRILDGARFPYPHPSTRRATVRVTAQWGWAAVPAPVRQACLIMAAETFQLKDAPFGVAGMDSFGTIRVRENRMASSKLARYCRSRVQVG